MLPDNIGFGRVRMRVLLGVPDSPDDDDEFPEARGASGNVKFVPAVTRVVNTTGSEPVTIGLPTVEGTFDEEGYLCGPDGVPGVYLIATDDTDNQPVNWTYKVQFNVTGVAIPTIDIHVPEDSDTDLTLITPVPSSPGVGQNQWENLVLRAEQAASAAEDAVFSIEVNGVVYTPDETGKVTLVIEGGGGGAELTSYVEQVASLADYPAAFPAEDHEHEIADVTGLQAALDGKAQSGHNHTIAQVSGLQAALDGKSGTGHGHAIGDVSGLQTALDGKQTAGSYAQAVHGHTISDVSGLQTALDGKQAAGSYATTTQLAGKVDAPAEGSFLRTLDPDIVLMGAGETLPDPTGLPDKYLWLKKKD